MKCYAQVNPVDYPDSSEENWEVPPIITYPIAVIIGVWVGIWFLKANRREKKK